MAMSRTEIETMIREAFPDARVEVKDLAGDGNHYSASVVTPAFKGVSKVKQHQMVYAALKGKMGGRVARAGADDVRELARLRSRFNGLTEFATREEAGLRRPFPCNREKCSEFPVFRPIRGQSVQKSPVIPGCFAIIPYTVDQGVFWRIREAKFPARPNTGTTRACCAPRAPAPGTARRWSGSTAVEKAAASLLNETEPLLVAGE